MKDIFNFKTLVIAGIFVFIALYVAKCSHDNETEELRAALHKEELRNDTLKKINEDTYEKLVADTVTKREILKIIKQLEIDVKNPKIVTRIVYQQKDVEKDVDYVDIVDSVLQVIDYYPKEENHTLKYSNKINLITKKGVGKFEFKPQNLDLVISETERGRWKATLKTDNEFVMINSLDVQALPEVITDPTRSNWSKFAGVKYNTTIDKTNNNLEVLGGFRYKKISLMGSANTSSQLGLGLMLDF
jgi:hypothetical protein